MILRKDNMSADVGMEFKRDYVKDLLKLMTFHVMTIVATHVSAKATDTVRVNMRRIIWENLRIYTIKNNACVNKDSILKSLTT